MGQFNPTLLIVEDEALIAADIAASVEEAGYAALVVPSTAQAHQALREGAIVGAILDFRVADGETGSLARCLKQIDIPFVIVSGSPERELAGAGIERERIFSKPAHFPRVIERLQQRFGMPMAVAG